MNLQAQVDQIAAARGCTRVKRLGGGGMGCVYLVRDEQTQEYRALKVMVPTLALDEGARNLFVREVRNALVLDHPNVVKATAAEVFDTVLFLEMEYCVGGSAESLMAGTGRVSVERATQVILDVLLGLDYAHHAPIPQVVLANRSSSEASGLVHRDLKPQNVFLTDGGVAKVGDFGLSKAFELAGLSGITATGTAGGTAQFMPRQQILNFKYAGPEVDVWAAAASMYYLLTGAPPRNFLPDLDPWQTVLATDTVPVLERGVNVPSRLAAVIDAALDDRSDLHFRTAFELRAAIEAA